MSTPLRWRKSSQSDHIDCVEVGWSRSSYSAEINCVEVAATAIRDTKNPGPSLHFPAPHLASFLAALRAAD